MHSPLYFYRYYTVNEKNYTRIERIFTHDELFFSSPRKFADPFDSNIQLCYDGSDEDWKKYFMYLLEKYGQPMDKHQKEIEVSNMLERTKNKRNGEYFFDSYLDEIGVFCMSEKNNHLLMWAHYADRHTGLCLEFKSISTNPFFVIAQKIEYQEKYPKVNFFKSTQEQQLQAGLLTKSKIWEYEQEWRIIDYEKGPGIHKFPEELLTGIIFGCKMDDKFKERIRNIIQSQQYQPKLYQAEMKKEEFGIEINEIN